MKRQKRTWPFLTGRISHMVIGYLTSLSTNVFHLVCGSFDNETVMQLGIVYFFLQTDHFTMEAVSLGKLKRVIVGHDGTNPGEIN